MDMNMMEVENNFLLSTKMDPDVLRSEKASNRPTNEELLMIASGTNSLRAALVLLIVVMIIFVVMKICRLAYQIRYLCQKKREESKSNGGMPQIMVQPARPQLTTGVKRKKHHSRSKHSAPSKDMTVQISLSKKPEEPGSKQSASTKQHDKEANSTSKSESKTKSNVESTTNKESTAGSKTDGKGSKKIISSGSNEYVGGSKADSSSGN